MDEVNPNKKPFKCPFNRCDRRFVEVDTLKNHVLDHDPIHRREFKLFQRVKVINDQGIYIIVYVDKSTNSFYLRLCDECEGDYGYQYVSAEKLYPISEPELNDIISVETGKAPNQKEYLDSLKLAIVTERKVHEDGHISWTIQFLINDETKVLHDVNAMMATTLKTSDIENLDYFDYSFSVYNYDESDD